MIYATFQISRILPLTIREKYTYLIRPLVINPFQTQSRSLVKQYEIKWGVFYDKLGAEVGTQKSKSYKWSTGHIY